jgi:hypothetical protein
MLLTVETNKSIAWTEWTLLAPLYELGVLTNATGRARSVSIIQAKYFRPTFLYKLKLTIQVDISREPFRNIRTGLSIIISAS